MRYFELLTKEELNKRLHPNTSAPRYVKYMQECYDQRLRFFIPNYLYRSKYSIPMLLEDVRLLKEFKTYLKHVKEL